MRDPQVHDRAADLLGEGAGGLAIHLRQDHREHLATIVGREVQRARGVPAHHAFNRAKTFVAGLVAVQIVEQLEMADVDEQQPERQVRPLCARPLAHQQLVEAAAVGEPGQPVLPGELVQHRF